MDFMLVFEIDKHCAGPRENSKSIIFSWLDEKCASSWRKCSYTAQQGIVFNIQFNKHRILQLDTVRTCCITNFSVRAPRKKEDQFHLYMIRRSVLLYFFRSSLQLVSISAFGIYHLSLTHFLFPYLQWRVQQSPSPAPPPQSCF